MKTVYPIASVVRLKHKKQAKLKIIAAGNIAQRYMELLRLRGQIHELESSADYGVATRSGRNQSPSGRSGIRRSSFH
jgi:hypothetical protein